MLRTSSFFALLCLTVTAALILSACADAPTPPKQSKRVEYLPLLSLETEAERRQIDLAEGHTPAFLSTRAPAFLTTRDQRLSFLLESQNLPETQVRHLRGGYGFAAPGRADAPTEAMFSVRCGTSTLFEKIKRAEPTVDVERFDLEIPTDCTTLFLEISFQEDDRQKRAGRRAVWVDPVLKLTRSEPSVSFSADTSHVLLITLDTTRRDVLGPYGGEASTPSLDRLAAEGVVFTEAYPAALATTPSHASLFSALPATDHGLYDNASVLADRHLTLAEVLRENGYQTAAFVSARPVIRSTGLAQGFDLYDDRFVFDALSGLGDFSYFERRAEQTVDSFLDWFNAHKDRPSFIWLHFFDPHQPYTPPGWENVGSLRIGPKHSAEEAAAIEEEAKRRYLAEIEALDEQLGRVFAALEEESTLVAVIADHGENFYERTTHLAFDHAGLSPEVANVPLILRTPERDLAGRRDALVSNIDVAPTLVHLLGIGIPEVWEGRSFRQVLKEGKTSHRPHVISEGPSRFEIVVRTPQWTYRELAAEARNPDVRRLLGYEPEAWRQLYDRQSDPEEREDLIASGIEPLLELEAIVAAIKVRQFAAQAPTIDSASHRKALEALGYLD